MPEDSFEVKRAIPRVSLPAEAEILERGAGTRLKVRVSEISVRGCYVDTLNPFDIGTQIDLRISHGSRSCEVSGKIIYAHAGFGMGVLFGDLQDDQRSVINGWLAEQGAQAT
jgi:hypothetical protein